MMNAKMNAQSGKLSKLPIKKSARASYDVKGVGDKSGNARFEFEFDRKTELTGYMKLKLWVQADGSDDMDLFVALEKVDRNGYLVPFPFFGNHDDGPVVLGWLRVSHRELDKERSTSYQPRHKHVREIKLKAGEIVRLPINFHDGDRKIVEMADGTTHTAYAVIVTVGGRV